MMALEWRRKLLHAGTAVAAPWVLLVSEPAATLALAAVVVLSLCLEIWRLRSRAGAACLDRLLPGVLRASEGRRLSGAFYLTVGYAATSAAFPARAAAAGILALAFGDTAAALVGRAWTRRHGGLADRRTAAGSAACFVATAAGVAMVVGPHPLPILAAAAAATLLERLDRWQLDNILIPLGTALVLERFAAAGL